jgi:hypothetical protein
MSFTATTKQVTATIRKIDGKALRNNIQTAAVHVIGHAMEFGHSPLANALADQLQLIPMTRKLSPMVIAFVTKNGPLNFSKDTGFVFSKAKRDAMREAGYDYETFVLEAPQWDDQPKAERKDEPLDVLKALEKLADSAAKKAEAGKCIDAELIPYIRALIGQYAGKKVLAAAAAAAAVVEANTAPATVGEVATAE